MLEHSHPKIASYPILPFQKVTLSIISYHFTIHPTSQNSTFSHFIYSFFYYFSSFSSLSLSTFTIGAMPISNHAKKKKNSPQSYADLKPGQKKKQSPLELRRPQTKPKPSSNPNPPTIIDPNPRHHLAYDTPIHLSKPITWPTKTQKQQPWHHNKIRQTSTTNHKNPDRNPWPLLLTGMEAQPLAQSERERDNGASHRERGRWNSELRKESWERKWFWQSFFFFLVENNLRTELMT